MCGINGLIYSQLIDTEKIKNDIHLMNDSIFHRGPDDNGDFVVVGNNYSCGMGMRRLSIIDLENGQQPIYSECKNYVIVFNGEIYNYKNLKSNLENTGVKFYTNSDTEVVLKLYETEGTDSFSKLDGMFAFSIYDKTKNIVIIARDYFGEKPLYYSASNNRFFWASELKSLKIVLPELPKISSIGLSLFFQLTYIPAPFTIFEGINKLEANNFIEINCYTSEFCIKPIKRITEEFEYKNKEHAINLTRNLVTESVSSRSISDVPIGTFLSGGVDSSIVSFCLSKQLGTKIDTFSIGFEKKSFDESSKARVVSKLINSNHHEFLIGERDLSDNLDRIILNFDEPFADSSSLATYLVSHKTKDYVKVALTGDGGDEVFAGYNKYYMGMLNKFYCQLLPLKIHNIILNYSDKILSDQNDERGFKYKLNRFLKSVDYDNDFFYKIIKLGFQEEELNNILKSFFKNDVLDFFKQTNNIIPSSIKDFRNIDRSISLEGDMLVKIDRTSMLASLECRAPFLNKKLWDFASQLPDNYLINGFDKKHILKKAFESYFPDKFLDLSKKGFGVPVGDWLRSTLRSEIESYIDIEKLKKQDIFNVDEIQDLVKLHLSGQKDNSFKVWTFYCFQKWYFSTYE